MASHAASEGGAMASFRAMVHGALGVDAVITGWAYRLLGPDEAVSPRSAVRAVSGAIGDRGNARILLIVGAEQLDPVEDADALALLASAPQDGRLAYEIAFFRPGLLSP
jgi:hypothetical protein